LKVVNFGEEAYSALRPGAFKRGGVYGQDE